MLQNFFSVFVRRTIRTVAFDPRRLRLQQAMAMTREQKKTFLAARWTPSEYLEQETSRKLGIDAVHGVEGALMKPTAPYAPTIEGLKQFVRESSDSTLEVLDDAGMEPGLDRGLPFERQAVIVVEARRSRIALAESLARAFKELRPAVDGMPRKLTRRKLHLQARDPCDWIAINLPSLALVHIMSPDTHRRIVLQRDDDTGGDGGM